jgi:FtsZ-binding cell division protein ZapB
MAAFARDEEMDSLASLEERITRAVELVGALKEQNEQLAASLKSAEAERDAAVGQAHKLSDELEGLRSERKQVRTRIEKLLGQMDLLSA